MHLVGAGARGPRVVGLILTSLAMMLCGDLRETNPGTPLHADPQPVETCI